MNAMCGRGQARLRRHPGCLGRHHSGADLQEDRHDHRLDVDHRGAAEDHRLLRQYYNTPTGIIGAKGDDIKPTPEGLAGKTIGVQVSTVHQGLCRETLCAGRVEVKEYQTQDEANQDLAPAASMPSRLTRSPSMPS